MRSDVPSATLLVDITTVNGVIYGFSFALYCFSAQALYLQHKHSDSHQRQALVTLLMISVVMVFGLINLIADTRGIQVSFVGHAGDPGGPLDYYYHVYQSQGLAHVASVAMFLLRCLLAGTQIWRLYVVWSTSRHLVVIMVLPGLAFLAYVGIIAYNLASYLNWTLELIVFLTQENTLNLFVDLTVTILIVWRIYAVRRRNSRIIGQQNAADHYTTVIAILIESFALLALWQMAEIITLTVQNKSAVPNTADTILFLIITYLLVMYRVTTGRGWTRDTERQLSSLQFNHGRQTTEAGTTRLSHKMSETEYVNFGRQEAIDESASVLETRRKRDYDSVHLPVEDSHSPV
ncbi:hypothetical protein AN958_00492 [Leucoagaricus sp. SymC.cos]|nr:hypothetical protein AN958_00492 [Leucoagaricus sp. SymC.cos]